MSVYVYKCLRMCDSVPVCAWSFFFCLSSFFWPSFYCINSSKYQVLDFCLGNNASVILYGSQGCVLKKSWGFKCIIVFFFLKRIAHWRQSNHYLLKIQSAEFGLFPKLPFALCICIIQLARQLLRVAILFCCFGFIWQTQSLGSAWRLDGVNEEAVRKKKKGEKKADERDRNRK